MVVAVAVVRMVQVAGHHVIRMSGVRHSFMAAAGAMGVCAGVLAAIVFGGAAVRIFRTRGQLVVVHMILMHVVHVTLMQIVGVPFVFHARMAASGAVRMSVTFVSLAVHDPSK